MSGGRFSRAGEDHPRELAAALVAADGSVPAELEGKVIDALAELLELARSLEELPLESVAPVYGPERCE